MSEGLTPKDITDAVRAALPTRSSTLYVSRELLGWLRSIGETQSTEMSQVTPDMLAEMWLREIVETKHGKVIQAHEAASKAYKRALRENMAADKPETEGK